MTKALRSLMVGMAIIAATAAGAVYYLAHPADTGIAAGQNSAEDEARSARDSRTTLAAGSTSDLNQTTARPAVPAGEDSGQGGDSGSKPEALRSTSEYTLKDLLRVASRMSRLSQEHIAQMLSTPERTALFMTVVSTIYTREREANRQLRRAASQEILGRLARHDYDLINGHRSTLDNEVVYELRVGAGGDIEEPIKVMRWRRGDSADIDRLLVLREDVARKNKEAMQTLLQVLTAEPMR